MTMIGEVETARLNVRRMRKATEVTMSAFYAQRKADGRPCGDARVEMMDALNAYKAADAEHTRLRVAYAKETFLPVRHVIDGEEVSLRVAIDAAFVSSHAAADETLMTTFGEVGDVVLDAAVARWKVSRRRYLANPIEETWIEYVATVDAWRACWVASQAGKGT